MNYGFSKITDLTYEDTIAKVTEELKKEGFGILTTIDVKETMKIKLDKDFQKYMILGACNPPFAFRALQAEEEIGLLLPCNIIVYAKDGKSVVAAFDPTVMTKFVDKPEIHDVAREMKTRLEHVLAAV